MQIKKYLIKIVIVAIICCMGTALPMHITEVTKNKTVQEKNLMLFNAITDDNEQNVKQAIEQGADSNACDKDGNYPLHLRILAPYKNKNAVLGMLLKNGAEIDARNSSGHSPLVLAYTMLLLQSSKTKSTTILDSDESQIMRLTGTIDTLLYKGANPNLFDPTTGNRPLHYALKINNFDHISSFNPNIHQCNLIGTLLDYDANPNVYNNDHETPLILYLKNLYLHNRTEHFEPIQDWLLAYGAHWQNPEFIDSIPTQELQFLKSRFSNLDEDTYLMDIINETNNSAKILHILKSMIQYDFKVAIKLYTYCHNNNQLNLLEKIFEEYFKKNEYNVPTDLSHEKSYKHLLYWLLFMERSYMLKNKIQNNIVSPDEIKEIARFLKKQDPKLNQTKFLTKTICAKRMQGNLLQKISSHSFSDIMIIN